MTMYYSPKELAYAELQRMEQELLDLDAAKTLNTPVLLSYTVPEKTECESDRIWKITEEMARGM